MPRLYELTDRTLRIAITQINHSDSQHVSSPERPKVLSGAAGSGVGSTVVSPPNHVPTVLRSNWDEE